jgi:hypothetical protein
MKSLSTTQKLKCFKKTIFFAFLAAILLLSGYSLYVDCGAVNGATYCESWHATKFMGLVSVAVAVAFVVVSYLCEKEAYEARKSGWL